MKKVLEILLLVLLVAFYGGTFLFLRYISTHKNPVVKALTISDSILIPVKSREPCTLKQEITLSGGRDLLALYECPSSIASLIAYDFDGTNEKIILVPKDHWSKIEFRVRAIANRLDAVMDEDSTDYYLDKLQEVLEDSWFYITWGVPSRKLTYRFVCYMFCPTILVLFIVLIGAFIHEIYKESKKFV